MTRRIVGSSAGAQRVVAEQPRGVGVVGRHRRLAVEQPPASMMSSCSRSWPSRRRTRSRQLGGGLAGERQAEHPLGADEAVGHQPHDARRHRLALARPGAGDHRHRRERRLDDGGLVGRSAPGTPSRCASSCGPITCTWPPFSSARAAALHGAVAAVVVALGLEDRAGHALGDPVDEPARPLGVLVGGRRRLRLDAHPRGVRALADLDQLRSAGLDQARSANAPSITASW